MKMVVLAGGFGKRLAAEINNVPKPLAPVKGRPFLEYLVELFKNRGQRDFIFCLHYKAEQIINYFGKGEKWGVNIEYSLEETPLGTGGALGLLGERLTGTFWLVNADTYLECDLSAMLASHRSKQAWLTMALTESKESTRFGCVDLDQNGKLLGFTEKGSLQHENRMINAGLYLMEPEILNTIAAGKYASLERDILPQIVAAKQPVYGFKETCTFYDIGIPSDYYAFQNWIISQSNGALVGQTPPDVLKASTINKVEEEIGKAVSAIVSLHNSKLVVAQIVQVITGALRDGHKIYLCGNGGSAADAQHLAAEMAGRFVLEREPLPAVALTTNTSVLTAIGNDYGYNQVFARQVRALVGPGDVLIGISTSGKSVNVIEAFKQARSQGAATVAFIGPGGTLENISDVCLKIASNDTAHIQEAHITVGHIVCRLVEEQLFGG